MQLSHSRPFFFSQPSGHILKTIFPVKRDNFGCGVGGGGWGGRGGGRLTVHLWLWRAPPSFCDVLTVATIRHSAWIHRTLLEKLL